MCTKTALFARFSLVLAVIFALGAPAGAQIKFQFGVSDAQIKRALIEQGYTKPKILKRGFKRVRAEACRDGVKYRIRLNPLGRIRSADKVGDCRIQVTANQVADALQNQNYRDIKVERDRDGYTASACRDGDRFRFGFNRSGEATFRRYVGLCRTGMDPRDIAVLLNQQGYDRINFTDQQLPRYVAEACRGETKVELVLSYRGRIRDERRIGRCPGPINPRDLPDILAKQGYDRIEVIDAKLPDYVVEACKDNRRTEMTLNTYGEIVDRQDAGNCKPVVTRDQLAQALEKQDFVRASIWQRSGGDFRVRACRDNIRSEYVISQYGELVDRKSLGDCVSPSIDTVSTDLKRQGLKAIDYYAEGCKNGQKVRLQLNGFGETVRTIRLGAC